MTQSLNCISTPCFSVQSYTIAFDNMNRKSLQPTSDSPEVGEWWCFHFVAWVCTVNIWTATPGVRSELFFIPGLCIPLNLTTNEKLYLLINNKGVLAYSGVTVDSSSFKKDPRVLAGSQCGPGPLTPGPPPGLDPPAPGERMSCHSFTRGSLFLQISLWPYATYHLQDKIHRDR